MQFLYPEPPAPGTVTEVDPGLLWARLPLPFALNHVNVWCIADGGGWWIVDCGIADETTRALWERLLAEALDGHPVRGIIATHYHPDHVGLAGFLQERSAAPLLMNRTEWLITTTLYNDAEARLSRIQAGWCRENGLDRERFEVMRERGNRYRQRLSPPPTTFRRLDDGMELRIGGDSWRFISGGGHSPEQMALYCARRKLLIAADQVLPSISPNVSLVAHEPDGNPLDDFLQSLDKLAPLPGDVRVLPSHGLPFTGLHERIAALRDHHRERLRQVLDNCREPITAGALMPVLFNRELDAHQVTFAMGEALAHLAYLHHQGRLERRRDGDRTVYRHTRPPPSPSPSF